MNNSPFEVFRRNLKPLMVFLTALALFAFVVLPVLDQYMRQNAGTGNEQVLATFDGQDLTRARVEAFTRNHQLTLQFLQELGQRTLASGKQPRTAGFLARPGDNPSDPPVITQFGINSQPSEEGTIRTFVFAGQATKQGFALSDTELSQWLQEYCDELYTDAELNALARQVTSNRMSLPFVKEQLRQHMLAQVFVNRGYAGLRLTTPEQTWESFLKLNQKATVEAYEVLVSDYVAETSENPGELEIAELYQDGKDRFPSTQSSEPGFRRRYAASFEYVTGSADSFLAEEISKLTEDEIRAAYEQEVSGGGLRLPAEPPADAKPEPAADAKPEPAADAKPEPAAGDSSGRVKNSVARLVAFQEQDAKQSDGNTSAAEADKPAAEADKPAAEADKPAPEADKPAAEADKPAAEAGGSAEPAEPKVESFEEARAGVAERLARPRAEARLEAVMSEIVAQMRLYFSERSIASGMGADSREKVGNDLKAKVLAKIESSVPAVKNDPSIASLVSTSLATAINTGNGSEFKQAILGDSLSESQFTEQQRTDVQKAFDSEVANGVLRGKIRPDLAALASQYGLTYETIGPYDAVTIGEEPIASSTEVNVGMNQQAPSFTQMMFTLTPSGEPYQPVFSPLSTRDFNGSRYTSWKIDDKQAFVPTLGEAREDVVAAWRLIEARKLALAAANKIVEQAGQAPEKTLADLVPEARREDFLNQSIEPFPWMEATFRGMPLSGMPQLAAMGMRFADGYTIGNVSALNNVGEEFMESVFATAVNGTATALNRDGTVVYVVRPTAFTPAMDILQEQFKQPANRETQVLQMLSGGDNTEILEGFFKSVDDKAGYVNYTSDGN